jgi:NAD(P)-dependent dehydrogenase (short-subunit alcohol dehydrogenase family)
MKRDERVAVVTGGNRGIGFEVCRQLARKGLFAILTGRDRSKAEQAAEKLREEGLGVIAHQLDVNDQRSVSALQDFVQWDSGRLDVLVNNAAVLLDQAHGIRSLLDAPVVSTLQETLEPNVFGPLRTCLALVPLMREGGYRRVVNVSSELGSLTTMGEGYSTYRISKTALNALTRILAAELRGTGVLVNAGGPGWVRTDMGGPEATRSAEEGGRHDRLAGDPARRRADRRFLPGSPAFTVVSARAGGRL